MTTAEFRTFERIKQMAEAVACARYEMEQLSSKEDGRPCLVSGQPSLSDIDHSDKCNRSNEPK